MEIYSMLDYNTIFFAECQDGNGFLFHFINFAQTQVIFYSELTSKNIPFLLYLCSCFQSRSLRRKLCSISQLITFTKILFIVSRCNHLLGTPCFHLTAFSSSSTICSAHFVALAYCGYAVSMQ